MDKQIIFTKVNTAEFLDVESLPVGDDCLKVKTMVSTISNGTEKANITGEQAISVVSKDTDEVVFPRFLGYSSAGVVVEKGKNVTDFEIGDRVAMMWSTHRSYNVIGQDQAVKLSDDVSFEEGALSYITVFPMAAIRKTRLEMGESALVMGLGTLGLIAVQLLKIAGAVPIIAVDPVKERREKALKFGADYALDPFEENFAQKVKEITRGGVKVAIEVTGQGSGLNGALDCMAKFGRVALLGCTRHSDFNVDYYRKVHGPGITLVGAHTIARPYVESHPGYFTAQDDMQAVIDLCHGKRLDLKSIIDETHKPDACEKIYERLVNDKNFPTVVQFDWSEVL